MQAPLAIIAGLFGLIRGVQGGGGLWISAAVLILLVVPFTLIVSSSDEQPFARRAPGSHIDGGLDSFAIVGPSSRGPHGRQRTRIGALYLGRNPVTPIRNPVVTRVG
jgi:hypothetical protein